jgi:hypothetical protein
MHFFVHSVQTEYRSSLAYSGRYRSNLKLVFGNFELLIFNLILSNKPLIIENYNEDRQLLCSTDNDNTQMII